MKSHIVIFFLLLKYQLSTNEAIDTNPNPKYDYTDNYPDDAEDYEPFPKSEKPDENSDIAKEQVDILPDQQSDPDTIKDISSIPILINPEIIQLVAGHLNQRECFNLITFLSRHPSGRQQPGIRSDWADLQKFNYFCPIPLKIWNSEVINLFLYKNYIADKENVANAILQRGLEVINRYDLIGEIREINKNMINERMKDRGKMSLEEKLEDRLAPVSKFNFKGSKSKVKNVITDTDTATTDKPKSQKMTYLVYFLLATVILIILCSIIIWYFVKKFYLTTSDEKKGDKKFYSQVPTLADDESSDEENDTVLV